MPIKSSQTAGNNYELVIERVFDAPIALVWQAWIDPEMLRQWWGPRGVTNFICEMNARPGGAIYIVMLAGQELGELAGQKWPMTGVVREVIEQEKLVFISSAIMNNKPILENLVTITFKEHQGKTKITLHVVVTKTTPEAAGPLSGMKAGWTQSIEKLGEYLKQQVN